MRRARTILIACLLALIASACGGDGAAETTTTTSSSTTTTTAPAATTTTTVAETTTTTAAALAADDIDRSRPQGIVFSGPPVEFTHAVWPFSVHHPGGWRVDVESSINNAVVTFWSPFLDYAGSRDEASEIFEVAVWGIDWSLEEEAHYFAQYASEILDEGPTTLGGEDAYFIRFFQPHEQFGHLEYITVVTFFEDALYKVTYQGEARDFEFFMDRWEAFLDSWTFHG